MFSAIALIILLYAPIALSACPPPLLLHLTNCTFLTHPWGIRYTVADPSQYLCLAPSTVVNSTFVIGSDFCKTRGNLSTAQCLSLSGNTFNISAAGKSYTPLSPSDLLARKPVWSEISPDPIFAGST
ncbi:hypothetical protein VHEMI07758 [[Torrubiella] hemipterigena]|uniref:Uncharacterized protein n=1 Tax=[Torrubiella] hemipterigena TaxID=1531966 RepID=A0A0A1T4F8_9HYPO|nr:hypothetical protein VHEMI07758 [[Torrubiella] hemipterigena]